MNAYVQRLTELWEAHTAPRSPDAPTVVSTFAGAGGSSLGYSAAGYRELLAVEWDDHAVACFRRNFPGVPVFHGDITDVDPAMLDLAPGVLDVLDGSPPCQGFSTSGHRQIDDPRNQLFRQYCRLLAAWQPRAFVMENVSGMVKGRMRSLFAEILTALKTTAPGYRVVARLMDASYFGVAQQRKRMIFIGVRADLGLDPVHPAPMTRPPTFRQAAADITDHGPTREPGGKIRALVPLIGPGQNGSNALSARGGRNSFFNLGRAHWDRPCFTITKTLAYCRGGILHPDLDRFLSAREIARVQSFPDAYDWGRGARLEDIWARVGNSVPPLMMRAIAQTIREQILAPAGDRPREREDQPTR